MFSETNAPLAPCRAKSRYALTLTDARSPKLSVYDTVPIRALGLRQPEADIAERQRLAVHERQRERGLSVADGTGEPSRDARSP